ncbi:glycosyl hydrolase family 26-domain-containing protein [Sordaria brevicollis]|uniref:Glycosyl hydrolase family 26-domain-containing protein n=1 Tax=Sordaria brevicollis TaxID=83679 RepID=A0AAE0UCX7_SORBR|nr:glycosyl hydrolase family 26-domain-containing protein [Sordaria brevicollis]
MARLTTRGLLSGLAFLATTALLPLTTTAKPVCRDTSTKYEAESALLSGTEILTSLPGFSGTGYVGGFDTSTDKITFTVSSPTTRLYDLSIRYAGIYGDKKTTVVLNSGASTEVSLPSTDSWSTVSAGQVLLNEGENTLEVVNNWGWYLLDYILLTPSSSRPPHSITTSLVNPSSSPVTKQLYAYLRSIYGRKILSGQQDLVWANYLTTLTGKTPALVAVDLMDYSPSRVSYQGNISTAVEDAITHFTRGGIVSVLWHWNAPTGLFDTPENPWWSGFYTRATDFDLAATLANPTGTNYTLLIRDIDAIAYQLKRLQSAGVPVLWRPLHEAEGGWFWWGAKGPAAAKELYHILYDRLTNHHGLDNLIWVWNSVAKEWYPGGEVVDIVSTDVYAQGNGPMSVQYNELVELGNDKKMVAAAEVGAAPRPDLLVAYEAHWLWFCVWGDGFVNNGEWNGEGVLREIYNHDYVLTLDEIQDWKTIGAAQL